MNAVAPPGIELDRLADFLSGPLGFEDGSSLEAEVIEGGRSNLTYVLTYGNSSWVLRRPPLGHTQPTAHNMKREYEVLAGLARTAVPAPVPLLFCEDESVLGAPFYVMERVTGQVFREPGEVNLDQTGRRRASMALIATLADIHMADYEAAGLGALGRPDGYLARQVSRWTGQLESGIRVSPGLRELSRRLAASVPAEGRHSLVHGDYRIDNVMLDPEDPGRVNAVLDWEMATLGDPLADLGMLLMYWRQPGERCASDAHAITAEPGFMERRELVERYEAITGFDVEHLDFYEVLAHFKLAVIVEGIHLRHAAGETVGESFNQIEGIPSALVDVALDIADRSGLEGLNGRNG